MATRGPRKKTIIGLIHLEPLPGTPYYASEALPDIVAKAVRSARALVAGGADGCLVQTVDRVYPTGDDADPARIAAMSRVLLAIRQEVPAEFRVGVQMMINAVRPSLAVAAVCGGDFVRASCLVGVTASPFGLVEGAPWEVVRYRHAIHAGGIELDAEIGSMHFRPLDDRMGPAEAARAAKLVGADSVALSSPDDDRTLSMIDEVRAVVPGMPVMLAGNTHHGNAARLLARADGAYVGSCLEPDGWGGVADADRTRSYMDVVARVEQS